MKPTLFLRIAAVLTLVHSVAHTLGGVLGSPTHGAEEVAVVDAMKSHVFNFMGSPRSYWDFFFGYGLFITVALLMQAVLLWMLASLAKRDPRSLRPILALLFLATLVNAFLGWKYFFLPPALFQIAIALCIGIAYASGGPMRSPDTFTPAK